MKHWLFIEPSLSGHHGVYLERIVSGALEHGYEVTITSSDSPENRQYFFSLNQQFNGVINVVLQALPDGCKRFGSGVADLTREIAYWRFFRSLYRAAISAKPVDRVFLPYMDYSLYAIALFGSPFGNTPFDGICMRPSFHFAEMGVLAPSRKSDAIKQWLFGRLNKNVQLNRLFTIDETLHAYSQKQKDCAWRKVHYLPDPAEFVGNHTRESARQTLGIQADAKVVLVYGALDERKGIRYLLDGMEHPKAPAKLHLLAVGTQSPAIRKLFDAPAAVSLRNNGSLHLIDRRVSDEEEQMCFAAADMVWLGYEGHYTMSGVLIKAVQAALPILATKNGLIGWHLNKNEIGVHLTGTQSDMVANAINRCLELHTPSKEKKLFSQNNWGFALSLIFYKS